MTKLLMKKACECGRKVLVKRSDRGPTPNPQCSTCKTYGVVESTRLFQEVNRRSQKTEFK